MAVDWEPRLDALVQYCISRVNAPGFAVGGALRGETVYARGFGAVELGASAAVDKSTIFHMASVTKPFVATAIMQLVECGRVGLDDRVIQHLPYFRLQDPRYSEITVRQMLNHSSGMPDVEDYEWDRPQYDDDSLERYVRSLDSLVLLDAPGVRAVYSNIGFEVLADLIAKVSGQSFEEYVHEHILRPIGMVESTLLMPQPLPANWARPHSLDGAGRVMTQPVYPYNRPHAASSTLHSNVDEMLRWAVANLNRGQLGGRILRGESYDLLWQPSSYIGMLDAWFGLSWMVADQFGHRVIAHSGSDVGFSSRLALVPDLDLAVVTMSNLDVAAIAVHGVATAALALAMGREPEPVFPTRERLAAMAGRYTHATKGDVEIEVSGGEISAIVEGERFPMLPFDSSRMVGPSRPGRSRLVLVLRDGVPALREGDAEFEKTV